MCYGEGRGVSGYQIVLVTWWCVLWSWPLLILFDQDARKDESIKNAVVTISVIGTGPAIIAFFVVLAATALGIVPG